MSLFLTRLALLQTTLNLLNCDDQEQDVFSAKEQASAYLSIMQEQQNSVKQLVNHVTCGLNAVESKAKRSERTSPVETFHRRRPDNTMT